MFWKERKEKRLGRTESERRREKRERRERRGIVGRHLSIHWLKSSAATIRSIDQYLQ